MVKKYVMHVISGTHWDREWRHTAEQSKPRLVELIDSMMDILERKNGYLSFCLDGGTVVLEDYFTVRPENRQRLINLVKAKRVQLVNWYTLPDTFTVAPEAMIRNLMLGQQMTKEYGGAMTSGYTATSYGQTSQLPQLYNGFGIHNAIFYRGTNKHYPAKPLFLWKGLDGSTLHTLRTFDEVTRTNWFFYVHQPLVLGKTARGIGHVYRASEMPSHMIDLHHYETALKLLKEEKTFRRDEKSLKIALGYITQQAMPYALGRHLLAMNMEDNDIPFEPLPEMIEELNKVSPDIEFIQNSLDDYMAAIIRETTDLPTHHGELRHPGVEPGFNGLLGATHSSRVKLKMLNERAETGLLYHAEPLCAAAFMYGFEYPKAMLDRAWRHLLLNHAHDSICGAAVDKAHEDMLYNFSVAQTVAEELTMRSIMQFCTRVNTAKRFKPDDHTLMFFNNLPFARKKVMPLVIDLPKQGADGGVIDPCSGVGESAKEIDFFDIVDADGNPLEYEVLSKEKIQIAIDRELDSKGIRANMIRRRILLYADVPSMGYTTYALRPREPRYVPNPPRGTDRPLIAFEDGVLENEFLKVRINPNGTFDLLQKETGKLLANQHYFTDNSEIGGAHLSAQTQRNPIQISLGSVARITLIESNTLRGIYRIDLTLTVPAAATLDGRDRLREERTIPITTWLTLEKGCRYLKVRTTLKNEARDHRLRVNFPSYAKTDYAHVESAFAVEKRDIRWTQHGDNFEGYYAFQPMQNFVDVSDGKCGLAILNKGLREYEVKDDAQRTIAITLLRTQRAYMTANCDMTPEEFDKYTGLHSFGTLDFHYALIPHCGVWQQAQVLSAAYDFKVDVDAVQSTPYCQGDLPISQSFVSINPADKVILSACKQTADGRGVAVRFWNSSDKPVKAVLKTTLPATKAQRIGLNETPIEPLTVQQGVIEITIAPHKIESIKLEQ